MKTCYIVYEYGGKSWEYYETPIKVFLSRENAIEFIKTNSSEITEDSLIISTEEFQMALEVAWDTFPGDIRTPFSELIQRTGKFPEYQLKDLQQTEEYIRRLENNWEGLKIEEVELCQ